jgi:hypothetical protein
MQRELEESVAQRRVAHSHQAKANE